MLGDQALPIQMSDWLVLLLPFATYALALAASGSAPPARPRRPQFDPILPTPKRVTLKLLRGALGEPSRERDWGEPDPAPQLAAARRARTR